MATQGEISFGLAIGAGQSVRRNAGDTAFEAYTPAAGGTGDVVGPASATDAVPVLFDGTTGKLIKNSTPTGTGNPVMDTTPTFITRINTPEIKATGSGGVDIHNNSGTQVAIFGAGGTTGASIVGTTNIGSASSDYHQITGGTGTITDTATGSSTNIDINFVPKGSGVLKSNGTAVLLSGGTLGTPSSGTLTNCTFPTLNQNTTGTASNVTGTVVVANGGTGKTTVTSNSYLKGNGTGALTERTYTEVKTDLSLNNVDNTSDVNKPVSTATQTALDGKQATLVSGTNIKTINGTTLLGSGDLVIAGGGSNPIFTTNIDGQVYTGTISRFVAKGTQTLAGVKISLGSLPTGANFSVDVRKNGTATTNSIFTSDTPISITTGQGATNGIYITTGTSIDNGSLVENDVLYVVITAVGSTLPGSDFECVIY